MALATIPKSAADSSAPIVPDPTEDIIKALKANNKTQLILELNLFCKPVLELSGIIYDAELNLLLECLQSNSKIKNFKLNTIIDDKKADQIVALLRENKTLESLTLNHARIGSAELVKIANALMDNNTLQSLNLNGEGHLHPSHSITAESMLILCTMLQSNKVLRHLGFRCFNLDERGIKYLLRTLNDESCSLTSIDLSQNSILNTVNILPVFCNMLIANAKLTKMHVDYTGLRGGAMGQVLEALKRNITMQEFSMQYSWTSTDVADEVIGFTARAATSLVLNLVTAGHAGMIPRSSSNEEYYTAVIKIIMQRNKAMRGLESRLEKEVCYREYVKRLEIPIEEPFISLIPQAEKDEALFNAAFNGNEKMAKYLLDSGANANSRHKDPRNATCVNKTPLFIAAEMGHAAVAKLLLNRGADPKMKDGPDCNGWSPYNVALAMCNEGRRGCGECADLTKE